MRIKKIISSLLVCGLLGGGAFAPAWANEKKDGEKAEAKEKIKETKKDRKMEVVAKAELTREKAAKIALAKVPKGKIKQADLEMERGILMWSFEIAIPGSKLVAEVEINAVTGELVGLDIEAPNAEAEAKETKAVKTKEGKEGKPVVKKAKADAKEGKGKKTEEEEDEKE